MDLNMSVFQEPRGVMRILHFVFSICAFATISGYSGLIKYSCSPKEDSFSYPFNVILVNNFHVSNNTTCKTQILGDFSSDSKFFVATGVLAMLYSLAIIFVYTKLDETYKNNTKLPLYDFLITVVFGVLWLSSSAAWAHGLTGLKAITTFSEKCCDISAGSFSTLNISVILGFLNFFLWAADLWFVYKETTLFQGNQRQTTDGNVNICVLIFELDKSLPFSTIHHYILIGYYGNDIREILKEQFDM
ncbi:hypothetical protein JTB14_002312 [Gonioctena quinquepunctata]|nr:hypothetical protein JTB14_002312 [Gonioctena quinquepunctata]